jgi:demethylmenaquinone methyltransferase/2-methoxy-6-polyprenyl-1,4-benzoquinol methylase
MAGQPEHTHFGARAVRTEEKQGLVDAVFRRVADRYDLMNDLMSFGLHRIWKDLLVAKVRPPASRPFAVLDIAGGTGDVAFRVARQGGPQTRVIVADINAKMLRVGEERARRRRLDGRVAFVEANAEELPFPDGRFDACTIAFGIRNVPRIETALKESFRVLKVGGRFLCLEFSHVDLPLLDRVYDAYSSAAIPVMGKVVNGDGAAYRYLVESIRRFPPAELFADMIAAACFARVETTRLNGGIVAIHSGWKL